MLVDIDIPDFLLSSDARICESCGCWITLLLNTHPKPESNNIQIHSCLPAYPLCLSTLPIRPPHPLLRFCCIIFLSSFLFPKPMSTPLQVDLRQCDFRVSLDPSCPASPYYHVFYSVATAVVSLSTLLAIYSLIFRVSQGRSPKSSRFVINVSPPVFLDL